MLWFRSGLAQMPADTEPADIGVDRFDVRAALVSPLSEDASTHLA